MHDSLDGRLPLAVKVLTELMMSSIDAFRVWSVIATSSQINAC